MGLGSAPPAASLHELILRQARLAPDATAVTGSGRRLTYGELAGGSAALAGRLRALGVGPEVPVAVCLPRSIDLVVAILAVLRAGGAYVPLDPDLPPARLRLMLSDTGAALLVRGPTPGPAHGTGIPEVDVAAAATPVPDPPVAAGQLAYILYTSGSTGQPKGVLVEHRAAVNTLWQLGSAWNLGPGDVALQLARPGFSASIRDLLGPLVHGATVALPDPAELRSPGLLAARLAGGITCVLSCLPSLLRAVLAVWPPCSPDLRLVNVISEPLPPALLAQARRRWGPGVTIVHQYGLSECAMTSLSWCEGTEPGERVPVGRPLPNTTVVILDDAGQPAAVGELFLGGAGVARGYLNRPALTAQRFLPDPAGPPGARLFRSGDLARRRADGVIELIGRRDQQVKVRGVRVELGEVEAVLREHPAVADAAVAVHPAGDGLIAYVVGAVDPVELRRHLAEQLPEPMRPASFVSLERLPVTANGKLDRAALQPPAPDRPFEAPRGHREQALAAMWAEVLGADRVGRHDNVFELGAHSLRILQVLARIESRLGHRLAVSDVFDHPSVAELAPMLTGPAGRRPSAAATDALSPVQRRLWFFEQLTPGSPLYTVADAWRLAGPLDPAALQDAVDQLARRHDILRTVFRNGRAGPVAVVRPAVSIPVERLPASELAAAARRPFDLRSGPLLRITVFPLGDRDQILLLTAHHCIVDIHGLRMLREELAAGYGRRRLPPVAAQYAELAAGQLAAEASGDVEFWRRYLDGAPPVLALPTDRVRPAVAIYTGDVVRVSAPGGLLPGLDRLAGDESVTFAMLALAGWAALLHRWSGQDDLVIGVPVAGRDTEAAERAVGCLMNLLPVRLDLSGAPTFRTLLQRARAALLAALAHREVPFDVLVSQLAVARDPGCAPLVQVLFDLADDEEWTLPGLRAAAVPVHTGTAKADLSITLHRCGGALRAELEYADTLFDRATATHLAEQLPALLAAAAADPDRPIGTVGFGDPPPAAGPARPYPDACLHDLVLRQAGHTPDAAAAVGAGGPLSYRELAARSAALAGRLMAAGVPGGAAVGVCLPRSATQLVAILAVLRAGAAFVPLDPTHPPARLALLLARSGAVACIAQPGTLTADIAAGIAIVAPSETAEPMPVATAADAPAGAYFTSGSSGRPKCVRLSHRNWVSRIATMSRDHPLRPGERVLYKTNLSYDDAIVEIFWPLTTGATVAVLGHGDERSPTAIIEAAREYRTRYLFLVPSMLALILDRAPAPSPARVIFSGGEPLAPELVRRFFEVFGERGPRLVNQWGVTEAGIDATAYECSPSDATRRLVPIGRPIANVRAHLLDPAGRPLPVGVIGELVLGGSGVGLGYLTSPDSPDSPDDPDDAFAPDRSGEGGGRRYRTGDMARWLPDGNLELIGRQDRQVKVRGNRVELGEVEVAVHAHPAVRVAAVDVRSGDLVAYVVPAGPALRVAGLRRDLAARLPGYLVPTAYLVLDELPMLPSGKVDRAALPDVDGERPPLDTPYVEPRDPVEQALAGVWRDLLGLDRVGVSDDFFALGGHSLRAVALQSRIEEEFAVRLPLCRFFETPTIEALAPLLHGTVR